jgi:hypothetical protein
MSIITRHFARGAEKLMFLLIDLRGETIAVKIGRNRTTPPNGCSAHDSSCPARLPNRQALRIDSQIATDTSCNSLQNFQRKYLSGVQVDDPGTSIDHDFRRSQGHVEAIPSYFRFLISNWRKISS